MLVFLMKVSAASSFFSQFSLQQRPSSRFCCPLGIFIGRTLLFRPAWKKTNLLIVVFHLILGFQFDSFSITVLCLILGNEETEKLNFLNWLQLLLALAIAPFAYLGTYLNNVPLIKQIASMAVLSLFSPTKFFSTFILQKAELDLRKVYWHFAIYFLDSFLILVWDLKPI